MYTSVLIYLTIKGYISKGIQTSVESCNCQSDFQMYLSKSDSQFLFQRVIWTASNILKTYIYFSVYCIYTENPAHYILQGEA